MASKRMTAKAVKVGEVAICPHCGKEFVKSRISKLLAVASAKITIGIKEETAIAKVIIGNITRSIPKDWNADSQKDILMAVFPTAKSLKDIWVK